VAGKFSNPAFLSKTAEFSPADTLDRMERTGCFGTCPSYTLSILEDGKVTFNGREFVKHKGEATRVMSQENLDTLVQKIRESHFMDLPSNPECESRYTDHSSVFLTITLDDERNSITHYLGCKGFQYEEELYDLEEAIDSLANTQQWIGES
jgi:hypothetical protein